MVMVAGCAGGGYPSNLTAATQGHVLLAMRFGGALPGSAATASAQHVCSVAAVECSISESSEALNQVRIGGCGDVSRQGKPTLHYEDSRRRSHASREKMNSSVLSSPIQTSESLGSAAREGVIKTDAPLRRGRRRLGRRQPEMPLRRAL